MKSYEFKGRFWVACQECEFGANGTKKGCSIGENISFAVCFNHGCWSGMLMEEFKNEIHNRRYTAEQ